EVQLAARLAHDVAGDADATGGGEAFQARGDVDVVAVDVVRLDDDVAHVDAHAVGQVPLGWQYRIALGESALDRDGGVQRVDHAGELRKEAVAGGLHDASAILQHFGRHDLLQVRHDLAMRRRLVASHLDAVALGIADENGGQTAYHVPVGHVCPSDFMAPAQLNMRSARSPRTGDTVADMARAPSSRISTQHRIGGRDAGVCETAHTD